MGNFHPRRRSWFLAALLCSLAAVVCEAGAQIPPASDAPPSHTPRESLAMFQVEPGFRVELVAAEPHLADPVAICFDAKGTLFACELHGYNLEGHYDVVELNKTGRLDKRVRRIPAPDWAIEKAKRGQTGTVKKLIDDDGDGRVDRSTVFADNLPSCYGLVPAREGIIVVCAPSIYYLADRDGDGVAEIREELFHGFNEGQQWGRTNHLVWGVDNWIYACGGRGATAQITGPRLAHPVRLGAVCYRFRPDGSALEQVVGDAGGFGLGISDWDDRMLIHNSTNGLQVMPIPYHYLLRNPYVASPPSQRGAATYDDVFPISQPHPWRRERGRQKAWQAFYGTRETTPNGRFTAACSPTFYRAAAFPPAFRGNLFVCEAQQGLINRSVVRRTGARLDLIRPDRFDRREFLASREGWFRPVNLATGPEGALYVVDMYREIIEDYSAIPRYLQQQYGLIQGNDRGRIWRVLYNGAATSRRMDLASAPPADLIAAISHRNAVWRQTAQRLLVERGDRSVIGDLNELVVAGVSPQARLQALYTLDGLHAVSAQIVARALADRHFAVRVHALRLAEPFLVKGANRRLLDQIVRMVDDPHANVRLQLALTLGEADDARATRAMTALAARYWDDPWMSAAVMSSVAGTVEDVLANLWHAQVNRKRRDTIAKVLCQMVGSRRDAQQIGRVLIRVAALRDQDRNPEIKACLAGILDGIDRRRVTGNLAEPGRVALGELLIGRSRGVGLLAYRLALALGLSDHPRIAKMFEAAGRAAADDRLDRKSRLEAIGVLAAAPLDRLRPVAEQLLEPIQPVEIQLASVDAIAQASDAAAADCLLTGWRGYSPKVRAAVVDAIFEHRDWLPALLTAIEKKIVSPQSLDAFQRQQLIEHAGRAMRDRAAALLARSPDAALEPLLVRYRDALAAPRDVSHGKKVFAAQCAGCHRVEGQGHDVGPKLSSTLNRTDAALLAQILQPSLHITQGYRAYTIVTVDGRISRGVLVSESATSVLLRREQGVEQTVLRRDIEAIVASDVSLMPEGLQRSVSARDMADLLAYLRSVYGPPLPVRLTLFDEDERFAGLLRQGPGKAALVRDDPFSGAVSLSITPPQRCAANLPGWSYPIREHPGRGEYRYLRLAWKSPTGKGAMIELAASGRWPPADAPVRRYYSGENTTRWNAKQIAPEPPRAWSVVTVDLWKDCGAFTLTGIAPTALGGEAQFDRIELLRSIDDPLPTTQPTGRTTSSGDRAK